MTKTPSWLKLQVGSDLRKSVWQLPFRSKNGRYRGLKRTFGTPNANRKPALLANARPPVPAFRSDALSGGREDRPPTENRLTTRDELMVSARRAPLKRCVFGSKRAVYDNNKPRYANVSEADQ